MKRILFLSLLFICQQSMAQVNKVALLISAQGKTVDAFLDSNNSKKTIKLISKKDKDAKFVIMNANCKNEADYNRSYMLVDDKNEDLKISFMSRLVGNTYAFLDTIFSKTLKGKTYKLYTVAVPKDPEVAARVRVRRILLCNVEVK